MSMALILALAAPEHALTCTATGRADRFTLAFTANAGTVSAIRLSDPQNVLDPLAKIVVYESSGSGMSKHMPPKAKLKLSGTAQGEGGFVFTSVDRVMNLTLTLTPAPDGGFAWRTSGWRMMDSTMRGDLSGEGSCVAAGAPA